MRSRALRRDRPELRLLIAGDGSLKAELQRRIDGRGPVGRGAR